MRPFCEVVVSRIFPVIRALLARELEKMGHTQTEIASYLRITQPAISQYKRRLRAKNVKAIEGNEIVMREIRISAMNIARNSRNYGEEMCRLCKLLRDTGIACSFCPELKKNDVKCDGCSPCS